jgi:diguanylate cyclase (GGDEF)-like protein/PAS domain S-box-containing protein
MLLPWYAIALCALTFLVVYQQVRLYRVQRDAKKHEELFQIVTENAADMIALVDMKGRRLYNSPAYKRILGYSSAELGATSSFEQIHPEDRMRVLEGARQARETGIGKRMEYRVRHKDGSWRVLESEASAVRNAKGEVAKLVIVNRDITDRKRAEEKLEHNLFHDPLTGLPNRRLFLDRLHHSFVRAKRDPDRHYALLLANVDHFKVLNERLGTASGDQVLQEIARRVSACLRQQDTVARSAKDTVQPVLSRLGGDEFTVLLDAIGDPNDAMRVATRIHAAIAEPLFVEGQEVRISASVGIALGTPAHEQPEEMLKDADTAMRRAKALGGSRCEVFDEALHTRAIGRMRLEADLRTAITEHQFRVHYQPVMRLDTQQVVSLEALLRWEHPSQGLISPNRFLEAAEDTGLLVSIGHWLLLQSCRQLSEWEVNLSGNAPVSLTLNVSARQFADARLVNDLQDALQQTGVNPGRLQLEMTESVAAADPRLTVTVLSHLKHMGIGVILDDFGVGSSSLRGLWQFPVDALKIDRSLVREMLTDRAATDIAETIITLGRKMNLRVIAEGIETARQAERLRELGCGYGQGYYFSQPLESKAALQFLRRQGTSARANAASAEAP